MVGGVGDVLRWSDMMRALLGGDELSVCRLLTWQRVATCKIDIIIVVIRQSV